MYARTRPPRPISQATRINAENAPSVKKYNHAVIYGPNTHKQLKLTVYLCSYKRTYSFSYIYFSSAFSTNPQIAPITLENTFTHTSFLFPMRRRCGNVNAENSIQLEKRKSTINIYDISVLCGGLERDAGL